MARRFNRMDGTAPVTDVAETTPPNVKSSVLPYECTKYGTAVVGAIIPVDIMKTQPGESFDINYNAMLELSNPMVRKCYNGFTVYFHTYYNRMSDLWEGANNFIDKGRRGIIDKQIPNAIEETIIRANETENHLYHATLTSLYDYMGVAAQGYWQGGNRKLINAFRCGKESSQLDITFTRMEGNTQHINALLPFMYQRLYRDKYSPKNLLQNNINLFPDNEDHFILAYEDEHVNVIDYANNDLYTWGSTDTPTYENNAATFNNATLRSYDDYYVLNNAETPIFLDALRFRQYKGDNYTTASPFADILRGTKPTIEINTDTEILGDVLGYFAEDVTELNAIVKSGSIAGSQNFIHGERISDRQNGPLAPDQPLKARILKNTALSSIDFNAIRALEAYWIFAERMARTNGDYNEMIYAQFGFNPGKETREAEYIGGFKQEIIFNTITQTSESNTTALGTQTAQGIGSGGSQYKRFTAPDYGYIMTVMSIMPDTIYTTGSEKHILDENQSDMHFPIFDNLGPMAIKNEELFVSGNATTDKDIFAYAERDYAEKSRVNRAYGLLRMNHTQNDEYASRIQARRFTSTPQLNNDFTSMSVENYDNQVFTSYNDPQFIYAIQSNVTKRSPMPYVTEPAGLAPAQV